jgi:hypothetical protein
MIIPQLHVPARRPVNAGPFFRLAAFSGMETDAWTHSESFFPAAPGSVDRNTRKRKAGEHLPKPPPVGP